MHKATSPIEDKQKQRLFMNITFLGAAREVTGSCFLVETEDLRFLVDCGMHQGGRDAMARNHEPFAFDPKTIDFVLLTHAHIDHSGLLPKLTRAGFAGPIYTTDASADLLQVMLPDSAHIQESDAERNKRHSKKSSHGLHEALPAIYTMADAQECLLQLQPIAYDEAFTPHPNLRCCFRDAGHILGSAIIELWLTEYGRSTKLVFSGDLGQPGRPILRDPSIIEDADILVIESTYGNRAHRDLASTENELVAIIEHTLSQRKGNIIVPAFAVGRTQEILYHLHRLTREGRLHNLKVIVDSPMATEATRITKKHQELFDDEAQDLANWQAMGKGLPYVYFTSTVEESMALNQISAGAIIISASGMCNAGRIKHHLRHNLPRSECSVLITGFQAEGTLGRALVDGAKSVRIFGEEVPVRASIHTIGGLSAHADLPGLLAWTGHFRKPPARTFVVHGEAQTALDFAEHLRAERGWQVDVPQPGERIEWQAPKAASKSKKAARLPQPNGAEQQALRAAITEGGAYRLAHQDPDFIASEAMLATRLQLELLKPEYALREQDIRSTVVVFGSARVISQELAQAQLHDLQARLGNKPVHAAQARSLALAQQQLAQARYYEEARRFAQLISVRFQSSGQRDFVVVTGGGPGIMEAANRGAFEVGARSVGLNVTLPSEQQPNPYITPDLAFRFSNFAMRKMHFMLRARALVAFPGGYGTLDELFEAFTLVQTGKMARIPMVLVGREFWQRAINFEYLLEQGYIEPEDVALFSVVDSAEDILAVLEKFYGGQLPQAGLEDEVNH